MPQFLERILNGDFGVENGQGAGVFSRGIGAEFRGRNLLTWARAAASTRRSCLSRALEPRVDTTAC
ncbi:hypothetical protein NHQ30_005111 [Ciborinia camelliae]|nr:hypothetical protein NHQ30_005111 [Ciborinia camelliae]